MPLAVHVDDERRVILVRGEGIVTDRDLLEYVQEYLSDPELRRYHELFDLREADLQDLTYGGLSSVASAAAATDSGEDPVKIAILVSQVLGLGLSRMYQTLREVKGGQRLTRVFQDRLECMEWLELPS
jgi:hypothetical protein